MKKKLCLVTGKMIPMPVEALNRIDGRRLPSKVEAKTITRLDSELADMRAQWAKYQEFRTSGRGHQFMLSYRKKASDFKALTGKEAPSIYADL